MHFYNLGLLREKINTNLTMMPIILKSVLFLFFFWVVLNFLKNIKNLTNFIYLISNSLWILVTQLVKLQFLSTLISFWCLSHDKEQLSGNKCNKV